MEGITCSKKYDNECCDCGRYFSSHSLHYDSILKRKVSTVNCSIGGNRIFNEDGELESDNSE